MTAYAERQQQQHQSWPEAEETDFESVVFMEDERVQASLGAYGDSAYANQADALLLTDKRVIHISGDARRRRSVFAAVSDISMVEIAHQPEGYRAYIWAGLAFITAAALWRVLENPIVSLVVALAVALMGVYLIIDRLTSPGERVIAFKAGASEIRMPLSGGALSDADELIAALFALKDADAKPTRRNPDSFAPR